MVVELSVLKTQSDPAYGLTGLAGLVQRSAALFNTHVWPQVAALFGPGRLAQVEAVESDCAKALDLLGIDYLFTPGEGEAFGIASRVQQPDRNGRPWDSFTMSVGQYIRLSEVKAASFGKLVPAVVIHAYLDKQPKLLSVGVARVRDLVDICPTRSRSGPTGAFHTWSFDDLRGAGQLIARIPDPGISDPFGGNGGLDCSSAR